MPNSPRCNEIVAYIDTLRVKVPNVKFPSAIEPPQKGQTYTGALLDRKGVMRWNAKEYAKPSISAKVIATNWKQVDGLIFWRYENPESEEWKGVGKPRND